MELQNEAWSSLDHLNGGCGTPPTFPLVSLALENLPFTQVYFLLVETVSTACHSFFRITVIGMVCMFKNMVHVDLIFMLLHVYSYYHGKMGHCHRDVSLSSSLEYSSYVVMCLQIVLSCMFYNTIYHAFSQGF